MLGLSPVGFTPVGMSFVQAPTTSSFAADFVFDYAIIGRFTSDFIFNYAILEGNVSFTPSAARTIKVGAVSTAFNAPVSGYWNMANPKAPYGLKDPNSTVDITMDWSDWFADIQDTAASFSWTFDNGAAQVAVQSDSAVSSVMVTGGNAGTKVAATCRVTSNSSPPRVEDRTVYLQIEDR